jgi:hypothetical protein
LKIYDRHGAKPQSHFKPGIPAAHPCSSWLKMFLQPLQETFQPGEMDQAAEDGEF